MHAQICRLGVLCCLVKKYSQSLPVLVCTHSTAPTICGVTCTWTGSLTAKARQEPDSTPGGRAGPTVESDTNQVQSTSNFISVTITNARTSDGGEEKLHFHRKQAGAGRG